MRLWDRLCQRLVGLPTTSLLYGQWMFIGCNLGEAPRLNGFPIEADDALVPDPLGQWSIASGHGGPSLSGRFHADALPDPQDVEAIVQLGRALRDPAIAHAGWIEWCGRSPLAPRLEETVKAHPLLDQIDAELPHLEQVCHRPRTHIRLETERVAASQARRIDPHALTWLATHTEDWAHRQIAGIQPRRILAQVRQEEWNLYENRVAARLVDSLVAWLQRQIGQVRRVLEDIFLRLVEHTFCAGGSRYRLRRISTLWGEAWSADHGKEVAEETLRRLERLLVRLRRLMDSPLYRNIPRGAQVPRALQMTNLFSHDAAYRGVARLWHHWSLLTAAQELPPDRLYQRHQELRRAFDAWCMLLLVRACGQLRLEPRSDDDLQAPLVPGGALTLSSGHRIAWHHDGTFALMQGDTTCLRFVPIIHVLEAADSEAAKARTSILVEAAAANPCWTVVLHPARPGTPPYPWLAGAGDPPLPGTSGAIDFVRVSPFSLDSVERVARIVRWATLAPRMLAYPPAVASPPPEIVDLALPWLQQRGESRWVIVRQATSQELARLGLERRLAEARAKRDELARQREQIDAELRAARGNDRRRTAELNRQKREHLQPLQKADKCVEAWQALQDSIDSARCLLDDLAVCPVCGRRGTFSPLDGDCFKGCCSGGDGCSSIWELRLDPMTRRRVLVLLPGGVQAEDFPRGRPPQWVDEVLGCDVLAIPAVDEDGRLTFRPPRSGPHSG
ncbi:MAG: hypothetical protein NZ890_19660 [Myxococcota bacterium]|nr:hypothetical protein [Myxococcota bacterium]